jgi:hypothetical protein
MPNDPVFKLSCFIVTDELYTAKTIHPFLP